MYEREKKGEKGEGLEGKKKVYKEKRTSSKKKAC